MFKSWLGIATLLLLSRSAFAADLPLQQLSLPPGFSISIFAEVPNARQMAVSDSGTVFVGTRGEGKVYALQDTNGDGKADITRVIADKLTMPNGVALKNGDLYVAEISRILRFDAIDTALKNNKSLSYQIVTDKFPTEAHHGWKFIRFGPDGLLYVPVGAPCNVCLKDDPRFATIMRIKADGSDAEIYASGVRNSVGFDWDQHGKLWFTDNGRDWLGNDTPPDELNYAPQAGMNFGFPYYYGKDVPDPQYAAQNPKKDFTPPALELPAHVAALGMSFYTGKAFPEEYQNQIIIPEHGSWNRTDKTGYQLILVRVKDGKVIEQQVFVSGWLKDDSVWGRPVATLVMPDGALLVSDDFAGVIYRIVYQPITKATQEKA